VLGHAGADGEDVGVEDDVLGVESHPLHQDAVRPLADAHLHRVLERFKQPGISSLPQAIPIYCPTQYTISFPPWKAVLKLVICNTLSLLLSFERGTYPPPLSFHFFYHTCMSLQCAITFHLKISILPPKFRFLYSKTPWLIMFCSAPADRTPIQYCCSLGRVMETVLIRRRGAEEPLQWPKLPLLLLCHS